MLNRSNCETMQSEARIVHISVFSARSWAREPEDSKITKICTAIIASIWTTSLSFVSSAKRASIAKIIWIDTWRTNMASQSRHVSELQTEHLIQIHLHLQLQLKDQFIFQQTRLPNRRVIQLRMTEASSSGLIRPKAEPTRVFPSPTRNFRNPKTRMRSPDHHRKTRLNINYYWFLSCKYAPSSSKLPFAPAKIFQKR